MRRLGCAALDLCRRRIGQIGQVAFAGVDDQQAVAARRIEHARHGATGALEQRHVVAERLAEPAGLEKVALHVDDEERGLRPVEVNRRGLGGQTIAHKRHRSRPLFGGPPSILI